MPFSLREIITLFMQYAMVRQGSFFYQNEFRTQGERNRWAIDRDTGWEGFFLEVLPWRSVGPLKTDQAGRSSPGDQLDAHIGCLERGHEGARLL